MPPLRGFRVPDPDEFLTRRSSSLHEFVYEYTVPIFDPKTLEQIDTGKFRVSFPAPVSAVEAERAFVQSGYQDTIGKYRGGVVANVQVTDIYRSSEFGLLGGEEEFGPF